MKLSVVIDCGGGCIVYKAAACLVQLHASYRLPGMLAGQLDVLHL